MAGTASTGHRLVSLRHLLAGSTKVAVLQEKTTYQRQKGLVNVKHDQAIACTRRLSFCSSDMFCGVITDTLLGDRHL